MITISDFSEVTQTGRQWENILKCWEKRSFSILFGKDISQKMKGNEIFLYEARRFFKFLRPFIWKAIKHITSETTERSVKHFIWKKNYSRRKLASIHR